MAKTGVKLPSIIIFDVDGVLVDVRGSFQKTTLETVEFFTGVKVTRAELHSWKNKSGYNDDWKLSTAWVRSLGGDAEYNQVKQKFVELYWGKDGGGNVRNEKWVLPQTALNSLAQRAELGIFTGRTREELQYTLERSRCARYFSRIVTVEDVKLAKPDPEGLLKILDGRNAADALYIGDSIDDALAAKAAQTRFVGVLPRGGDEWKERAGGLRTLGAETILHDINQLDEWLSVGMPSSREST
jgi:HAD superfamily phosphatase